MIDAVRTEGRGFRPVNVVTKIPLSQRQILHLLSVILAIFVYVAYTGQRYLMTSAHFTSTCFTHGYSLYG